MIANFIRFSIEVIYQGDEATRSVHYQYRVGPRTARRVFIEKVGNRYHYRMEAGPEWNTPIVHEIAAWIAKDLADRKVIKANLEHFLYRFYQLNEYLDSIEEKTLALSPLQTSYIRPSVALCPSYLRNLVNMLRQRGNPVISNHSLRMPDRERLGGHSIRGHDGIERIVYAGMFATLLYFSDMQPSPMLIGLSTGTWHSFHCFLTN